MIIIGNGDEARAAISHLESASLTMTKSQRDHAQAFLATFTAQCNAYASNPSTL